MDGMEEIIGSANSLLEDLVNGAYEKAVDSKLNMNETLDRNELSEAKKQRFKQNLKTSLENLLVLL